MANLFVPDAGRLILLQQTLATDCVLRIFDQDVDLLPDMSVDDIHEVEDSSYAPITLDHSNWTFSTISGLAVAEYPRQEFTFASPQSIYGYFVTQYVLGGTGTLLWIQKADCVGQLLNGGSYNVTPRFSLAQRTTS